MRTLLVAALLTLPGVVIAQGVASPAATWSDPIVAAHVAAAKTAAGDEYKATVDAICRPGGLTEAELRGRGAARGGGGGRGAVAQPEPDAAARVFDNLYFVGQGASSWAVNTSEGIILIDTLGSPDAAERLIEGGLRKAGLDPASIKYIIVTHSHGDHFGGAQHLVNKYGARLMMSEADWRGLSTLPAGAPAAWRENVPKRDLTIVDGQRLTLGGQELTLYVTPGHTTGSVSIIIPVTDRSQRHVAALWGGTAMGGAPDPARYGAYAESADRFLGIVRRAGVDVPLSNHGVFDNAPRKLAAMRTRGTNDPNPWVTGVADVAGFMTVLRECAKANHAAAVLLKAKPDASGWRGATVGN